MNERIDETSGQTEREECASAANPPWPVAPTKDAGMWFLREGRRGCQGKMAKKRLLATFLRKIILDRNSIYFCSYERVKANALGVNTYGWRDAA